MIDQIGVISGIVGVALALIFGVAPHLGITMPRWLARAGFVTGIILLAASPFIFFFGDEHQAPSSATNVRGNCNSIVTGGNNGTVNTCTNVIQAPAPFLRVIKQEAVTEMKAGGPYNHVWVVEVVTPSYPASNLEAVVIGPNVLAVDIGSVSTLSSEETGRSEGDYHEMRIANPAGRYFVSVKTATKETPAVTVRLNAP